jgi:type III restriction enzyme
LLRNMSTIFGVPFTFLPHEGGEGPPPPPPPPKTVIEPVKEKEEHEIMWPNILRVDHIYRSQLIVDIDKVARIELDPYESITEANLAAIIAGKPNPAALSEIDLKEIGEKFRLQTIIFETAKRIYNYEKPNWQGRQELFLVQLIRIVERFITSDKISIRNDLFRQGELRRRILTMLNLNKIIQHIWEAIRTENTVKLLPVFDIENPIRSTGNMRTWHTSKPCGWAEKSHINFCVFDSTWEASEAYLLDNHANVASWVKNDHVGFVVIYNYQGVVRKYYPDFIIKQTNGEYLILETKGKDTQQNKTKRAFLDEWVKAVNNHGGFGKWNWAVSFHPSDLESILDAAGISQDEAFVS